MNQEEYILLQRAFYEQVFKGELSIWVLKKESNMEFFTRIALLYKQHTDRIRLHKSLLMKVINKIQ